MTVTKKESTLSYQLSHLLLRNYWFNQSLSWPNTLCLTLHEMTTFKSIFFCRQCELGLIFFSHYFFCSISKYVHRNYIVDKVFSNLNSINSKTSLGIWKNKITKRKIITKLNILLVFFWIILYFCFVLYSLHESNIYTSSFSQQPNSNVYFIICENMNVIVNNF